MYEFLSVARTDLFEHWCICLFFSLLLQSFAASSVTSFKIRLWMEILIISKALYLSPFQTLHNPFHPLLFPLFLFYKQRTVFHFVSLAAFFFFFLCCEAILSEKKDTSTFYNIQSNELSFLIVQYMSSEEIIAGNCIEHFITLM